MGKIKPNRDFYEEILQYYKIQPEELLFLDDREKNIQGASTITQQYAKNLFLNFDKTWERKLKVEENTDCYESIRQILN